MKLIEIPAEDKVIIIKTVIKEVKDKALIVKVLKKINLILIKLIFNIIIIKNIITTLEIIIARASVVITKE